MVLVNRHSGFYPQQGDVSQHKMAMAVWVILSSAAMSRFQGVSCFSCLTVIDLSTRLSSARPGLALHAGPRGMVCYGYARGSQNKSAGWLLST